jgi:hypothetical protein
VPSFCFGRHQSIHLGRSGRDDQPRTVEIGGLIRFLNERDAGRSDSVAYLWRDDDEIGAGRMERRKLRRGNRPTANHHDAPPLQLQKRGKQPDDKTPSRKTKKPGSLFTSRASVASRCGMCCSGHQRGDRRQGSPTSCIQQQQLHAQVFPADIQSVITFSRR